MSRSAGADNVFLRDEQSVTQNGLCEIKITDNQIMNFNDRADYLPDILYKLDGLEYYLNDFASTGITYYNLCDKYNVEIDDATYSCIMFNDQINITQGLEEKVYTEILESAETDYTKADKTDRRINQTYLIVDKQNQIIESVVSNVTEQNNKISQITQTVDEINSKISDIADITTSAEDTDAQIELEEINESNPIQIKVHPIVDNIAYDYPHDDYPQNDYSKIRTIRFYNSTDEEIIYDYSLCEDLLYYDSENYDEFLLDYGDGTPETRIAQITKRCKWNADGSVGLLATPEIHNCNYPEINLTDGNYTISLLGYNRGYIFARLMAKNIYTTQFYTKAETNSLINQTSSSINLSVDAKLSNYSTTTEVNASLSLKVGKNDNDQIISMINASADTITLSSNRLIIDSTNFKLNSSGNIIATGGTIGGWTLSDSALYTANNNYYLGTTGIQATIGEATVDNIIFKAGSKFGVSSGGTLYAQNAILSGATVSGTINATAGSISGNLVTSGISATNLTTGTLTGAGINLYNGTGFLKMLLNDSNNPFVSALNVGLGSGGVSFRNSGDRSTVGSQLGNIYASSYGNIVIAGNNGTYIQDVFVSGQNISNCYQISGTYQINGLQDTYIRQNYSIVLKPNANGGAYIWGIENYNRILTEGGSPSTLSIKENVKEKDTADIPEMLNKIKLYDYKYIDEINNGKKDYGYIIDYLESIDGIDKYFVFNEIERNGLKYKTINHEHLSKFLLGAVIELQKDINSLKEEK